MPYFDHAATTPMRDCARQAWAEYSGLLNPGGQYGSGRRAAAVLAEAREEVAELLGADPVEVVFTGSGTEADNLAVRGLYRASRGGRVVASPIEHPAVLETVKSLAVTEGARLEWLPVTREGRVEDFSLLDAPAGVATLMWANNETGVVQPVAEAAARAAVVGTPFHVDAVQAVGKVPVDFHELGATTLAASAHKFGGPRGTGILLARRSPAPTAVITGGGQERGLRSGTVDVASAAATAAALREAVGEMAHEEARLIRLGEALVAGILREVPDARVTTPLPALPGHVHVLFPGANGDALIMLLDSLGLEASTGSACAAGVNRSSHVLEAMGVAPEAAAGALRLTLGRTSTEKDVEELVGEIGGVVTRARIAGSL
ncbi:cysteine desulfurase family protein [Corynebacterium liangguodongii]|uniref:Cysteine desulfurase n=1 Tax=Corynebacterium liangguodongii TaxID=2079535 RepID=A0A2S0WDJ0_9CORY|nr:cysteine desulfurase family protein [Corynebacterium liangguodongii]AWB83845.1 cysteine desulfurase [Corynebacterium liangguodongii]PWB98965.1 cysteine desulfurase [Corynebacterium liangguodongii]